LALNPAAAYPSQINTTDPTGYPYGRAKNVAAIGDGTGTPLEEKWVSDVFGAQQALLVEAGLTPSNTPDKVGASQYLDALKVVARRELQKAQVLNWPERATVTDSGLASGANNPVGIGYAPDLGVQGNGLWVLQSSGTEVWTSEDGQFWTLRATLGSASFTNPWIAYGKINGVAGFLLSQNGNPTIYYTSTDGITWTAVATTAVPANPVSAYSSSLGLWVMAGNAGAIYTSPTGLANTWTARSTPGAWVSGCGGAKRIVWNGLLFVILPAGSYNKCLTSPDGLTWTERTMPLTGTWSGLAYGAYDGIWMAVSNSTGPIAISADGLTWSAAAGAGFALANDLAVIGPLWVMPTLIANVGGIIWSTDKGASWHGVNMGNHRVATLGWNRILAGDNRFAVAHTVTSNLIELAFSLRGQ
jgi:hypothetical protein